MAFANDPMISDFEKFVNKVTAEAGKAVERAYPYLTSVGAGGGFTLDNSTIDHEALMFRTEKILTEEEGVPLIADIINLYFDSLKKEKNLFAYLRENPFTYKNLRVKIFVFKNELNDVVSHPNIHMISLRDGVFWCYTVIPHEKRLYDTEWEKKEPFKQAAQRLAVWKDEFETGPVIPNSNEDGAS
jgi:hypothetical protein